VSLEIASLRRKNPNESVMRHPSQARQKPFVADAYKIDIP
jgi:hypothetical protein